MEVRYIDAKVERLCNDEREMKRRRADLVKKLPQRVNALKEAVRVGELPSIDPMGHWHQLNNGQWQGRWAGSSSPNHRIIVEPSGADDPEDCTVVTVLEVGFDYHGRHKNKR